MRSAVITERDDHEETETMAKAKTDGHRKPGKRPLAEGETTARVTCNMPESMHDRALRKAGPKGISAYLRRLVEKDLSRAS